MRKHSRFRSSRLTFKRLLSFAWAALTIVCAFAVADAQLESVDKRGSKGKIDSSRTQPVLIEIENDGGYRYEGTPIILYDLRHRLDGAMDARSPEYRKIAISAKPGTSFGRIAELMLLGRKLEVDDFILVDPMNDSVSGSQPGVEVKIVLEEPERKRPRPGPLFLGVERTSNGSLLLNGKAHTEDALVVSLKRIFESRGKQQIFIEGSRDVEKTVFVRSAKTGTYGELMKILRIVESTGAYPIGVEIDWL